MSVKRTVVSMRSESWVSATVPVMKTFHLVGHLINDGHIGRYVVPPGKTTRRAPGICSAIQRPLATSMKVCS